MRPKETPVALINAEGQEVCLKGYVFNASDRGDIYVSFDHCVED